MAVCHELKLHTDYFDRLVSGQKTFELRKDDRDFQVGDTLELVEVFGDYGRTSEESRKLLATVSYILRGYPGLDVGYCVLALVLGKPSETHA
jgi:ParB family chromosome partitioning protein